MSVQPNSARRFSQMPRRGERAITEALERRARTARNKCITLAGLGENPDSAGVFIFQRRGGSRMEQMEDTQDVYDSEIELYLEEFCKERGIKDIRSASQSVWNAGLMYIRKHVFPDASVLKSKARLKLSGAGWRTNCNMYDPQILERILWKYAELCMLYDKAVSYNGFCFLTGIDRDTIRSWNAEEGGVLSSESSALAKKLKDLRWESLQSKLETGAKNPVGILGLMEHEVWNRPEEAPKKEVIRLDQLPDLRIPAGALPAPEEPEGAEEP